MANELVSQKVMDLLSTIGLNSYERKLYVTLLSKGSSNAGTLSELSGVPRSRTYDVLESLADKGFVILQNSKPIKYVAVEPKESLERAKAKHKEEYESAVQRIERFKGSEAVKELEELFENGVQTVDVADMTGSLKGRHSMHQQLESMLKKASGNVSILTSEKGLEEIVANHTGLLEKATGRGVDVRIATTLRDDNHEAVERMGSAARLRRVSADNLEGRFAIADGAEALVALTDDDETHPTQDTHMWSQSRHLAGELLQPMFDRVWETGEDLN